MKQSFDYIENTITIRQIIAYRKHWKNTPPADVLIAAYLGYGKDTAKTADDFIDDFQQKIGNGGVG